MNGNSNTGVVIDHPEAAAIVPTASAVAAAMMGASEEVATLVISALATEGSVGSVLFSSFAFFFFLRRPINDRVKDKPRQSM